MATGLRRLSGGAIHVGDYPDTCHGGDWAVSWVMVGISSWIGIFLRRGLHLCCRSVRRFGRLGLRIYLAPELVERTLLPRRLSSMGDCDFGKHSSGHAWPPASGGQAIEDNGGSETVKWHCLVVTLIGSLVSVIAGMASFVVSLAAGLPNLAVFAVGQVDVLSPTVVAALGVAGGLVTAISGALMQWRQLSNQRRRQELEYRIRVFMVRRNYKDLCKYAADAGRYIRVVQGAIDQNRSIRDAFDAARVHLPDFPGNPPQPETCDDFDSGLNLNGNGPNNDHKGKGARH